MASRKKNNKPVKKTAQSHSDFTNDQILQIAWAHTLKNMVDNKEMVFKMYTKKWTKQLGV
jgi:hypothetical protein